MKVIFFLNTSQEDESMEIFSFPDVIIEDERVESEHFTEAEYFLMSLDSVNAASEMLEIINFYNEQSMLSLTEIKASENVKAIIYEQFIAFKRITSSKFDNEISLDIFLNILLKWKDYLLIGDKAEVVFEIN
ncbi:hypothetical protein RMB03_02775 [Acinetobacter sp. V91_7]|uniref:hypothetical protein n=1 Tax=unclassified Acinetobacter TaxID=196816 RepID=UPI00287ED308|nr:MULTISPECIES: hypothetical protein [unclassified Acinetobacter]MDS7930459.1 hypothetical protein [Acinetobacter sp. V102_4]MDS7932859.1 hypothetical protein [Acinetobacter sp. V91_4B]MDS7961882.1 hypothetical protein [Acinetobacter sp. V91_7]MDS8028954.1 hypothetical protein [Acinetobacter sp. V91_13]